MKSESDDDSLMVMTIIDDSSTDDLSSQKPAPESSPRILTPVSSHETVSASTTSPQLKVDNEENPAVQEEESATVSISEAPKAERVENVLDGFDGPKVRRYLLTEDHNFTILNNDKPQGRLSKYLVSKDVLSVSSPVLRSLIKPSTRNQTAQAQEQGCENVNAPPTAIMRTDNILQLEHDEYSLYRILKIIHFHSTVDRLHNLSFKAWKDLTVLAETYQWTRALQPWKSIWIANHRASFLLPGYEDWLYLSKVYGRESDYEVDVLITTLSLHCHFDGTRISRALAYGSLLQSIRASELDPEFSEWEGSVAELHEQIESLTFSTLGIVIKEHKCVIQGLKKSLSSCLTSFELLDLQSRYDEIILRASSL
ncbi:hypothetical protein TWF192_000065 [Orbilia oligospora]|nr:hypothetical protein TWF192_000065 [Orbilia oligospora]